MKKSGIGEKIPEMAISPPDLATFDAKAFREALASHCCSTEAVSESDWAEYREAAEMLGILLATHYSESLDRLNLWTRISAGVMAACAKAPGGNPELFISAALDFVKADPARVARDGTFKDLLTSLGAQSQNWREGFTRYLKASIYAVLVHMRRAWAAHKGEGQEVPDVE